MAWNNETTLSLIKLYEERVILWKKDHKNYFNAVMKEDAWLEISAIMNQDKDVLKKKIESLRGSRRREKNRMRKSMGTGKGRKDIYVSKWFAWESLSFLDDPEELRPSLATHEALSENKDVEQTENSETAGNSKSENSRSNSKLVQQVVRRVTSSKKRFVSAKRTAPKRLRRSEDSRIDEAYNIFKMKSQEKKDENTTFADYVAEKLKKMTPRVRSIVQHQISTVIFNAEMNEPLVISTQPPTLPQMIENSIPKREMNSPSSPYSLTTLHSPSTSTSSHTQSPLQSPTEGSKELYTCFSSFSDSM